MILTVDIGNTTIAFGTVDKGVLRRIWRVDTSTEKNALTKEINKAFKAIIKYKKLLKLAVICSVVPDATNIVEQLVIKTFKIKVKVIGRDVEVPIKNRYRNPAQVGQDRLVGAWAGLKSYGSPLIVIDLGTAITFDVINAKEEYIGGAIVPGLRLSAESLFLKTALLPNIAIKAPKSVIGQTTQDSILSGLFYGYGFLCQGFIQAMSKNLHPVPKVVMTGGHTHLMAQFIASNVRIIDEHLVHKGMYLLVQDELALK